MALIRSTSTSMARPLSDWQGLLPITRSAGSLWTSRISLLFLSSSKRAIARLLTALGHVPVRSGIPYRHQRGRIWLLAKLIQRWITSAGSSSIDKRSNSIWSKKSLHPRSTSAQSSGLLTTPGLNTDSISHPEDVRLSETAPTSSKDIESNTKSPRELALSQTNRLRASSTTGKASSR